MSPEKMDHTGTLEDIVGRFEVAWDRGEPPAVEDFITDAGPLRKQILPELLLIDIEFRFKAGISVRVEDYLNRFPELGEDPGAVVALIIAEYRFRSRSHPSENQQAYLERFPKYREVLASKFGKQQPVAHLPRGEETVAFSGTERTPSLSAAPRVDRSTLSPDVAALLDVLQELQILTSSQLAEFSADLPNVPDSPRLIGELERRGWLTAYQADLLKGNRSKQLVFGSYILLEPLGKGGMGQVFKARHRVMKRVVALKIIRKGHLPHGEAVQRFTQEIEAAAKLSHPNIVTSHDAGRAGDFHFFVMELVDGVGFDALLKKQGPLPIGLVSDLIRQTALGLQHAHEQGLVHRDIKPQNLILDAKGVVKILDMGLARVRYDPAGGGAKALTQMGAVMGTADYIAPEQILECSRVDGRADIYSLGCTFYQLLTGQPPFPGNDLRRKLEQHMKGEVRPAEELRADLPPEVRAILRKMLACKPGERYASAAEVASALAPFCTMAAAVAANGPSDAFADSNPAAETFVESPPLAKIAPPVASPSQTVPAQPDKRRQSTVGIIAILLGVGGIGGGMLIAVVLLAVVFWPKKPAPDPEPTPQHEKTFSVLDRMRHEDLPAKLRDELPVDVVGVLGDARARHEGTLTSLTTSPDGRWIATTDSKSVRITDARTMEDVHSFPVGQASAMSAFSPDGLKLAGGDPVRIWDVKTGKQLWAPPIQEPLTYAVGFTPDGNLLTVSAGGPWRLWKPFQDKPIRQGGAGSNKYASSSLHGTKLLYNDKDESLWLWDVDQEKSVRWEDNRVPLTRSAFSLDGTTAATGYHDGQIALWDVSRGKFTNRLPAVGKGASSMYFLPPDGKRLVVNYNGATIVWNVAKKEKILEFSVGQPLYAAPLDGGKAIVASDGPTIRVFDTETGKERKRSGPRNSPITGAAFTPDGKQLLLGSLGKGIQLWDLNAREVIYDLDVPFVPSAITISADGARAAAVSMEVQLGFLVWDLPTGKTVFDGPGAWEIVKLTPDGNYLLAGQGGGKANVYDSKGKQKGTFTSPVFAFLSGIDVSSDGRWAVGSTTARVKVEDPNPANIYFGEIPTGKLIRSHSFKNNGYARICLSPDDRYLYGVDYDEGKLWIWEVSPNKGIKERFVQTESALAKGGIYGLALSRDGKTALTSDNKSMVIQWSVPNGKKVKTWQLPPDSHVFDIAPDNRHAVIRQMDGRTLILRLAGQGEAP